MERDGIAGEQQQAQDIEGYQQGPRKFPLDIAAVPVPAQQICRRREHRGDIRDQLGLGEGEEDEDKGRPDEAEPEYVAEGVPLVEQPPDCREQGRRPGHHGGEEDGDEEEETVLSRMFRRREARDIMVADEGIQKDFAVDLIHENVPGQADEEGQKDALGNLHFLHQGPLPRPSQIEKHDQGREGIANGAFDQEREAAENVGYVIFFAVKGNHRHRQGEHEGHVRHGSLADVHEAHAGDQKERRKEGNGLVEHFPALDIDVDSRRHGHDGAGQAGGDVGDAEKAVREHFQPVEKRRFIVPVLAEDARREPVAGEEHFLCRFAVDRFIRVHQGYST